MNKRDLLTKTRAELLKLAQRLGLRGVTALKKSVLAGKIQRLRNKKGGMVAVAHPVAAVVKRRALRKPTRKKTVRSRKVRRAVLAAQPVANLVARSSRTNGPVEILSHKVDAPPQGTVPAFVKVFREEVLGELPEAYGTGRLFLTARDPQGLYAYWDLTGQQMADYRSQASDAQLWLRVHEKNHRDPVREVALPENSRDRYIPVHKSATTYVIVLGFWRRDGCFHVVSRSREATTPADQISGDTTERFVTLPLDIPFRELCEMIRPHRKDGESLAEAFHRLQASGFRFPFTVCLDLGSWSEEQIAEMERWFGNDRLWRQLRQQRGSSVTGESHKTPLLKPLKSPVAD